MTLATITHRNACALYPIAVQRSIDGISWEPLFWMNSQYDRPESVGIARQTVDGTTGLFLGILFADGGYIYCPLPDLQGVVRIFRTNHPSGGFSKVVHLDRVDHGWATAWEMLPHLVRCDRCHKAVECSLNPDCTSGIYDTRPGSYWARFSNENERIVCDQCIWADPRYIEVYGVNR